MCPQNVPLSIFHRSFGPITTIVITLFWGSRKKQGNLVLSFHLMAVRSKVQIKPNIELQNSLLNASIEQSFATNMASYTDKDRLAALDYHALPRPGKIGTVLTMPARAPSCLWLTPPGVAEPVREIAKDAENAYKYTSKGNLVAVISDGTAILGLGNLGPLASKPVMEGKSLLFKRFAGVDSVDVEVDAASPQDFINVVKSISATYGGINLEDIKAPQCFEIEKALIEQCDIPIMHDDQHGTAIVTVAGMVNALEIQGKDISTAKFVCLGAGAAAIACMKLLITAGTTPQNIYMLDSKGVIHSGRTDLNEQKQGSLLTPTSGRSTIMNGADASSASPGPTMSQQTRCA